MYFIEISNGINNIISLFYRLGLWHRGDEPTVKETRIKVFYLVYHLLFPISLMAGAITCDSTDEFIFLAEVSIAVAVLSMKLFFLVWKKKQILEMLNGICVYSIEDKDQFTQVNDKLKRFMDFVSLLLFFFCAGGCYSTVVPIFGSDKELFYKIGFPLDYTNKIAFWMATAFIFTETVLSIIAISFSVTIWYSMLNCALRYKVLGNQIRNTGVIRTSGATTNKRKKSEQEKQNLFRAGFIVAIDSHQHIREY